MRVTIRSAEGASVEFEGSEAEFRKLLDNIQKIEKLLAWKGPPDMKPTPGT